MKKKLTLIFAFSLSLSSFSAVSVSAALAVKKPGITLTLTAEKEQEIAEGKKINLTVDEAVEKAINYSHELKNMADAQDLAEENEDDARHDLFYATEYATVTSLSVQFKNLTNTISNYEKNTALQKDAIALSVYNLFAAITEAEDNITLYEKNMDIEERSLAIAETKLKLGLISQSEYNSLKTSYEQLKANVQTLRNALDTSYMNLSKIMGDDLSTTYNIALDSDYTPIDRTINLQDKIIHDTGTSLKVKEAEENVTVTKYSYDVYSELYSSGKKEEVRNSYNTAVRELESIKTNLEAQVKTIYNQIIDLETSYNSNLTQLEELKSQLAIKETQLALGKITQIEYDKAEYEIESLEYEIKHQAYSHTALMTQFNNIDLAL